MTSTQILVCASRYNDRPEKTDADILQDLMKRCVKRCSADQPDLQKKYECQIWCERMGWQNKLSS